MRDEDEVELESVWLDAREQQLGNPSCFCFADAKSKPASKQKAGFKCGIKH